MATQLPDSFYGKNVSVKISDDNIVTITLDANKEHGPSKSGKSTIVSTTGGLKPIPIDNGGASFVLSLNLVKK